jgi:dinuclear metal center YbgI/SA1388 family protein
MEDQITVRQVAAFLDSIAPPAYQESYDNTGLLTGDPNMVVTGILTSLDCIESIIDEAVARGANLIVAHHPIIFRGLKRLTGANYVERTIIQAIRHNIAIIAIHTNLDNVFNGVNRRICEKIGLEKLRILQPSFSSLAKLVSFVPKEYTGAVLESLYQAGAGQIGEYKNCSFQLDGTGTFTPGNDANPFLGEPGKQEWASETRIEIILPAHRQRDIIQALKSAHPYEEVAYYLSPLVNENQEVGAGMIGELPDGVEPISFLQSLKERMDLTLVRHTAPVNTKVRKVAVCGGAGSFLLKSAISAGADVYVSADFKYHEFFDADNRIMIADIGHYESEVYTKELLKDVLIKKFPTFAINFSETVTNPISYI